MVFTVQPTTPPTDKWDYVKLLAWLLAAVLVEMVVGQLFAFEEFVPLIESFWLPGGKPLAYLVATVIVVSEVLALPYLLRMALSPAMRAVSLFCSVLVPMTWLFIAIWLNVTTNAVTNIGLFGTKLPLPVGWWVVAFILMLVVLSIWIVSGRPIGFGRHK